MIGVKMNKEIERIGEKMLSRFPGSSSFMLNWQKTQALIHLLVEKGIIERDDFDKKYLEGIKILEEIADRKWFCRDLRECSSVDQEQVISTHQVVGSSPSTPAILEK